MKNEEKAKRVLQTLTGPWEKRALVKMARALPLWITSDHLTVLGIIASFIIFAGFILLKYSHWWIMLSNAGFVIHWWADSLDGTVARVRHQEREKFGYFVDHICDAFSTALICVGLGLSTLVHPGVGLAVAIGYLLMNIYAHVISYVERVFKISYGRIGPTEIRIIFIVGTSFMAVWNPVLVRLGKTAFTLGDVIAFTVSAAFLVIFAVSSIKKAIELDKLDRAKWTP